MTHTDLLLIFSAVSGVLFVFTLIGVIKEHRKYNMYFELVQMFKSLTPDEQRQFAYLRFDWMAQGHSSDEVDRRLHVVMTHYIQDRMNEEIRKRMGEEQ